MALNLSRNTKLFVSTVKTGNVAADTWEVPVLDGYTFSQEADSETITLNEAGDAPVRGQKIFNTALTPAEISIPTYVRPFYNTTHSALERVLWEGLVGDGSPAGTGTYAKRGTGYMEANFKGSQKHELLKLYLFFQLENTTYRVNEVALNTAEVDFSIDGIAQITWTGQGASIDEIDTSSWASGVDYTTASAVHTGGTEAKFIKNKLSTITLKKATGTTSATIFVDFAGALDPLAAHDLGSSLTWTVDTLDVDGFSSQTISIDATGNFTHDSSIAVAGSTIQDVINEMNYQTHDVLFYVDEGDLRITSGTSGTTSLLDLTDGATNDLLANIDTSNFVGFKQDDRTTTYTEGTDELGTGSVTEFNVPITGGSLTIENNITYLTPEELGKVNFPIGSFTGTRSVTGSVTAYLNTGTTNTAGLLSNLASDTATVTHEFEMTMSMGGGANTPRVDFLMNHAHLVIPSFNVEDVLATEITFTGLGEEIDATDELVVRYVSPTS